jgi:polyphosphate glucokinase
MTKPASKTKTAKTASVASAEVVSVTTHAPAPDQTLTEVGPMTLTIDIGGSGLKMMVLDANGRAVTERIRAATPETPTPEAVLAVLDELRLQIPAYDRVSVGFPGVIKHGTTLGAFNLDPGWANFPLQAELERRWGRVRAGNDADVAGYGAITGDGVELVVTLGTGMGAALFTNGHLCPGLEIGHHIWRKKGMTYEDYLGRRGLDRFGKDKWNRYLLEAIANLEALFNWDHLYLGGGNTKKITFDLPANVTIVSNETGLLGGVALWRDQA